MVARIHCGNELDENGHVTGGIVEGVGINIEWQDGPVINGEQNGAFVQDVLFAVLSRMRAYNDTDLRCRENSLAITKIEEAMSWLDARQKDRVSRGVQGSYSP